MSQRHSLLLSALDASSNTAEGGWRKSNSFSKSDLHGIDNWPASPTNQHTNHNSTSTGGHSSLYRSHVKYGKSNSGSIAGQPQRNGAMADTTSSETDGDEISLLDEITSSRMKSPISSRVTTHVQSPNVVIPLPATKGTVVRNSPVKAHTSLQPIAQPLVSNRLSLTKLISSSSGQSTGQSAPLTFNVLPSGQVILSPEQLQLAKGGVLSLNSMMPAGQMSVGRPVNIQTSGHNTNTQSLPAGQMSAGSGVHIQTLGQSTNAQALPAKGTIGLFQPHGSDKPKIVCFTGTDWAEISHEVVEVDLTQCPGGQKDEQNAGCVTSTLQNMLAANSTTPTKCAAQQSNNLIAKKLPQVQSLLKTRDWKHSALARRPLHNDKTASASGTSSSAVTSSVDAVSSSTSLEEPDEKRAKREDGYMVVCMRCGTCSQDFEKCESCNKPFPKDVKIYKPVTNTSPAVIISKKDFYGKKLQEQSQPYSSTIMNFNLVSSRGTGAKKLVRVNERKRGRPPGRPSRAPTPEPEMVTISSDEEEAPSSGTPKTSAAVTQESSAPVTRRQKMEDERGHVVSCQTTSCHTSSPLLESSMPAENKCQQMHMEARSIRLGSYKGSPFKPVKISDTGIDICMEAEDKTVEIHILAKDIVYCFAHFGSNMPVLFLLTTPGSACQIRSHCKMNCKTGPYYDPASNEDCHKHIVILLKESTMNDSNPRTLNDIFKEISLRHHHGNVLVKFIDYKAANSLLVKSTPTLEKGRMLRQRPIDSELVKFSVDAEKRELERSQSPPRVTFSGPVKKLFVYPPGRSKGAIEVTNEDLFCLNEGEFLNDVIIDFYNKYLFLEKLSEHDRKRTHIFNSFFYKRLTGKGHKEDLSMSLPQRRHCKVKTWTRQIDIFEKDFIIIPINEHAHWFLAIICFPGLHCPVYHNASSLLALQSVYGDETEDSPQSSHQSECGDSLEQSTNDAVELNNSTEACSADTSKHEAGDVCGDVNELSKAKVVSKMSRGDGGSQTNGANCDTRLDDETLDVTVTSELQPEEDVEDQEEAVVDSESDRATPPGAAPVVVGGIKKQPCILVFDSLAGPSRSSVVRILREYLQVEWDTRKKTPRTINKDTMKGGNPKCPQQDNYSDCGVFICQYVESFFMTPIKDFSIPMKCTNDWFSVDVIKGKRKEIKSILQKLHKESQQRDRSS